MSTNFPPKGEAEKRIGAYNTPLQVVAQDSPGMTVRVQPGSFFNSSHSFVEFGGGNTPAIVRPTVNPVWVVVALSDSGLVELIYGAESPAPSIPVLAAGKLPLGAVHVTPSTLTLTSTAIVDIRPTVHTFDGVPNLATELANRPTVTDLNNALALKADVVGGVPAHNHVVADITDFAAATVGLVNAAAATKAEDASVVHLTGNETVGGNKVFTGGVSLQPVGFQPVSLFSTQTAVAGDAGITVARGANPVAQLKWDETSQTWQAGVAGVSVHTILTSGTIGAKADKVASAVAGNFASLAADGNLVDSGKTTSDFATAAQGTLAASALQANQTITLSGDVAGSGTTAITTTLSNVGTPVTDSLVKVTTDFKGRVSATSAVVAADLPNLPQSQITNLVTDLSGKASTTHTHVAADVTDFATAADDRIAAAAIAQSQVTGLATALSGKAAATHGHVAADVTDFTTEVGSLIGAATIAQSQVTDLVTDLAGKAATTHGHAIADVTGLATALSGKAATTHGHVVADITDFAAEFATAIGAATIDQAQVTDLVTDLSGKAATVHSHAIADVTGLATALGDKAPTADPVFTGVPVLPGYALASLPASVVGGMIFVSDANTGVGTIAFGDGTDWIDIRTGVVVA